MNAFPTKNAAALAAIIMMSAQETTPAHFFSTATFASSMISNPATLPFGGAVFSEPLPSSKIDASHPFHIEHIHIEVLA